MLHLYAALAEKERRLISERTRSALAARILIIDEPTVGVDVRTKGYLHRLIWKLAAEGVAILIITSELSEMTQLADRIYVMNDYRIVAETENSRDYDEMSARLMTAIQLDNDRRIATASVAMA